VSGDSIGKRVRRRGDGGKSFGSALNGQRRQGRMIMGEM